MPLQRATLLTLALSLVTLSLAACAAESEPEQHDGYTMIRRRVSLEQAKAWEKVYNETPICRPPRTGCSISAPDADGMVIYEALGDCTSTTACPGTQIGCGE
jgi:hypothetical protein